MHVLRMHRTSGPAEHRILLIQSDRRTPFDRQTFSSCAPTRELIKYPSVSHYPVTPTIDFLSFNFLAYQQIQNRTKFVATGATVRFFTQAELWWKSFANWYMHVRT